MSDMRVYCGTYHKYNCGSIFGKWFDLDDFEDKDEFIDACKELHKDEEDPELMFQDWEGIPDGMCHESGIKADVWELLELENEGKDMSAMAAYISNFGNWDFDGFNDKYIGECDNFEDYAEERFDECEECPIHLRSYIDMEAYARDIEHGYCHVDGHLFYNH